MTREEAIAHGKEQLEVFGGEHAEFIKLAIEALEKEPCEDMGEVSDGYHTFNQLYHQRAILFATIVNQNKDLAWKSYKHSDGNYCFDSNGEWFIVGIDTPEGSYTYHYQKEYWDYFDCQELDCGKEWDGHTEEDVTRLLSLKPVPCGDCVNRQAVLDMMQIRMSGKELYEAVYYLPSVTPVSCIAEFRFSKEDMQEIVEEKMKDIMVERKKGKWIIDDEELGRIWHCHCSNCKKDPQDYIGGTENWWLIRLPDYCPNCGIEMQGVEE